MTPAKERIFPALGFAFGLPTLVLADRRLRPEGLLNPREFGIS